MATTLLNSKFENGAGNIATLRGRFKTYQVTGNFVADVIIEVSHTGDPNTWHPLQTFTAPGNLINNDPWLFTRARVANFTFVGGITVTCEVEHGMDITIATPDSRIMNLNYSKNTENEKFVGVQTFSRSTDQTYFDAATDLLVTQSPNTKVINGGALELWEARTIVTENPRNLENWAHSGGPGIPSVVQDLTGIDGVPNSGFTVTDTELGATSRLVETSTSPLTPNVEYTFQHFILKEPLKNTNVPGSRGSISGSSTLGIRPKINPETGDIVSYGGSDQRSFKVTSRGNWWQIQATIDVVNNTSYSFRLLPAISINMQPSVSNNEALGSAGFDYGAVERGSFATPPILDEVGLTRSANNFSFNTPQVPNNDWFMYAEIKIGRDYDDDSIDAQEYLFYCEDSSTDYVMFTTNQGPGEFRFSVNIGGVISSVGAGLPQLLFAEGDIVKIVLSKSSTTGMKMQLNEFPIDTNALTTPSNLNINNPFFIGSKNGITNCLNSAIMELWTQEGQITDAQMAALTAP